MLIKIIAKTNILIYLCVNKQAIMGNEQTNKAEQSLREIAQRADVSIKTIYSLVTQAYINDAHYQEKVNGLRSIEVQYKQLELMRLQVANEIIENKLLSFKLRRKEQMLNTWVKFTSILKTKKP